MDRVLELGGHAAGYCGRLFVGAGAEVVRIDPPVPDPAWASDEAMALYLHAGKRRVATSDRQLIARLAARADVIIHEGRTADEISAAGFDEWSAPVRIAITPFGRSGPKRNWRATPGVLLAMGGYTYLVGDADREPLTLPGHYVEFQSGAMAYVAANAARLAEVDRVVDIGMLEVVMSLSQFTTVRWHCLGDIRSRHGSDFWFVAPSDLFACRDGWIYLNVVPQFWDPLVILLDKPELALDARFETNDSRMANRAELRDIIARQFGPLTRSEIEARALQCRVPLGAVQTFGEVLRDSELLQRGVFETVSDGTRPLLSPRVNFAEQDGKVRRLSDVQHG